MKKFVEYPLEKKHFPHLKLFLEVKYYLILFEKSGELQVQHFLVSRETIILEDNHMDFQFSYISSLFSVYSD